MNATHTTSWNSHSDLWVLSLNYFHELNGGSFVTSNSSGELLLYSLNNTNNVISQTKAHSSSINAVNKLGEYSLASASDDGVKIWDLRQKLGKPLITLTSAKNPNFLSLGSKDEYTLAAGTELFGSDAEIHMWDVRNPSLTIRSFVDSHHDDVTDLKFHGSLPYLMSGSTDGCVNVYNLNEPDEDEALHQAISYASVHLCHFTRDNRIAILSHMESLGFWDLNSTEYELNTEAVPNDLGDVRSLWPDCEYVVDLHTDFVAYGANLKLSLTLMPFNSNTESFNLDQRVLFPLAHGEEVVRDVCVIPGAQAALTCGEDGIVKAWALPSVLENLGLAEERVVEHSKVEELAIDNISEGKKEKHKSKKSHDHKKKARKDKKSKKDIRFKPY